MFRKFFASAGDTYVRDGWRLMSMQAGLIRVHILQCGRNQCSAPVQPGGLLYTGAVRLRAAHVRRHMWRFSGLGSGQGLAALTLTLGGFV
jgi:hypothetical protein